MTKHTTSHRSLFSSGLMSFSIKIFAAVSSFLVNVILARLLGAEATGLVLLALSIITIASVLARLGLGPVITRLTAKSLADQNWGEVNGLFKQALTLSLSVSLLCTSILVLGGEVIGARVFHKPELGAILPVMGGAVAPLALCFLTGHAFQGRNLIIRCLFFQALGVSLLFLCLLVPLYWFKIRTGLPADSQIVSEMYFASTVALLALAIYFWFNHPDTRGPSVNRATRSLLRSALPFYGTSLLALVTQHSGQIILGAQSSGADVAVYVIALRIAALVTIVLAAFSNVAMPRFAVLYHNGEMDQLRASAANVTRTVTLICAPVLFALLIFPEWILGIFGSEFSHGSNILRILVMAQFFNVATGVVGGLLAMTDNGDALFRASLSASILMVFLCVTMIPVLGVEGAAIAQAASITLQMTMNTIAVRKRLGFIPLLPRRKDQQ